MSNVKNGGPAVPSVIGPPSEFATGMTLLDWFAGQAFPSIYADLCKNQLTETERLDRAAKRSIAAARGMLAAREVAK